MKGFRKAVVAGYEFFWNYHFDCLGYKDPSYLLAIPADREDAEIKVYFYKADPAAKKYPMNKGIKAKKDGQEVVISLNQAELVADILLELLLMHIDFDEQQKYIFSNGERLLEQLGYELEL